MLASLNPLYSCQMKLDLNVGFIGVYMNVACHSCYSVFPVCFLFVTTLDVLGFCEAVKSSWFLL